MPSSDLYRSSPLSTSVVSFVSSAGMVKALTSGNRQLESLSFDCGPGFTHKHLKTLGGHFTNLTTLRLRNTDKVNDSHMESVRVSFSFR
jgi:hypothetical protein